MQCARGGRLNRHRRPCRVETKYRGRGGSRNEWEWVHVMALVWTMAVMMTDKTKVLSLLLCCWLGSGAAHHMLHLSS